MDDQDKARGKAGAGDPADDEGLIELTDTVDGGGAEAAPAEGEDLIELTEVAEVSPAPSDEQLERALRKVVREIYAEKIEGLLLEVVQETVSREIQKIKRLLSDHGKS